MNTFVKDFDVVAAFGKIMKDQLIGDYVINKDGIFILDREGVGGQPGWRKYRIEVKDLESIYNHLANEECEIECVRLTVYDDTQGDIDGIPVIVRKTASTPRLKTSAQ